MAGSAPLGELIAKTPVPYFVISTFRSGCYDSSRHVDASHWLTQPSDKKICVSGNCFPSRGQNDKIEGGARGFSLSVRQGLSGKHNCFVGHPLKAILLTRSYLALRSATLCCFSAKTKLGEMLSSQCHQNISKCSKM